MKRTSFNFWLLVSVAALCALVVSGCLGRPLSTPPSSETDEESLTRGVTSSEDSTIVIVIPEDPTAFNGVVSDTGYNQMVMELTLLGLADIDPYGKVFPELAEELPTLENGGVILDEENDTMQVTWKLRRDVVWADGTPVTAEDVIFTWEAITDPQGGIWAEGVDYTERVEKVDDYTFTVYYNAIYPTYLTQFGGENFAVFPAHYCDASQGFVAWDCSLNPLSNGPYILKEWARGDHLTFERNPRYYQKGKPRIERIVVKIVPEKAVQKSMLLRGDADLIMWATEAMVHDLQGKPNVGISISPTERWVMRLFINQAARGTVDAQKTPHPILADVRVRQAIRAAIDVDTLIEEIWFGLPKPVWTEFFRPPYVCDVPRPAYDPEMARQLLEEAGWKDFNGDGVRECHGCLNAKEGDPMAVELAIYTEYGNELELTQQLIGEMLRKIGMQVDLSMVQGAIIWADSGSGGSEQNGNFDIDLWDDGYPGIDPTDYLWYLYHSESAKVDNGWNVARWINPEFDALLEQVYTLDEDKRKTLFCQMALILDRELPVIPLFSTINAEAHSSRLQGVQSTVNDVITWNAADWVLVR